MSSQFNEDDNKAIKDFLELLVNLGMSHQQAYESVNKTLNDLGWTFAFFNDIEDFWIIDNEIK